MKRLLLALILLLPWLVSAQTEGELRVQRGGTCERPVMAMNRDSLGLDTLRRIDTVGNDLMALRGADREGNVILEVAGFGITLGACPGTGVRRCGDPVGACETLSVQLW